MEIETDTEKSLTPEEALTIDAYNSTAQNWAEAHAGRGFWQEEMTVFQTHLPSGTILEVGCGGGRDAEDLISRGYSYIGTDPAPNFIEVAQARNPGGMFQVSNLHELPFESNSVDGFWASAMLLHIPKRRIESGLSRLHNITRSNGVGFISIKEAKVRKFVKK